MRLNELRAIGGGKSGHAFFQETDLEAILDKKKSWLPPWLPRSRFSDTNVVESIQIIYKL